MTNCLSWRGKIKHATGTIGHAIDAAQSVYQKIRSVSNAHDILSKLSAHVLPGDEPDRYRRAEGEATGRRVTASHCIEIVACGIEAGDRRTIGGEDLSIAVCSQARQGAEIARQDFYRKKRTMLQRPQTGVGCVEGVSVTLVEGAFASLELRIYPLLCIVIENSDLRRQTVRIDTAFLGQLLQGSSLLEIT